MIRLSIGASSAWAETFPCSTLSKLPTFNLSASDTCRASIHSENLKLCLSRSQWAEWLSSQSPPQICGNLQGNWKLNASLSEEPLTAPKEPHATFRLKALPKETAPEVFSFWQRIQRIRETVSARLSHSDDWGVQRSLILGEKDQSSPQDFLRLIGFFHLLTASGVHLYALALILGWLSALLLERARIPASQAIWISRGIVLLSWIWAWILCGCRAGMLRPALIVGARLLAKSLGFRWRYWTPFVLSFLFEFTFAWIGGEKLLSESRVEIALSVGGFLMAVQEKESSVLGLLGGWIFVALAQAYQENLISLTAPLLSVLTLPVFCTFTYPLLLIESALGMESALTNTILSVTNQFLHSMTAFSLSVPCLWMVSKEALVVGSILSLTILALLFRRSQKQRLLVFGIAAIVLFGVREFSLSKSSSTPHSFTQAREVIQLDVGQGDSALVKGTENGLIDVGSARALSDAQWVQLLAKEGITQLDWVGLTHLDEDHRGGLDRLSRLLPIRCVASSQQEVESPRGEKLAQKLLSREISFQSWEAGCVNYPVYEPKDPVSQKHSGNLTMSAVLIPLISGDTYLSAGDAEGGDEITILKWANEHATQTGVRILKISHHGSKTSSDPKALQTFHPDLSVISVGMGNSYGHPSQEVLERLAAMKIPVFRTDQTGAFRVEAFLHPQREHRP